jgi:isopentenyldiphosphate isomerase
MEMLQIVHASTGEPTGEALPRAQAIAQLAWCRSTNVFVMNSQGQVLCHQRSLAKERLPGVWSTHLGGHVGGDETFETNAQKELGEEAGIDSTNMTLIPWRTTRIDGHRLWVREFVTLDDRAAHEFVPQPGEVEAFAWHTPEEIVAMSTANPKGWCAGTHHFASEYYCMRAALFAAHTLGALPVPQHLHSWVPALAGAMVA